MSLASSTNRRRTATTSSGASSVATPSPAAASYVAVGRFSTAGGGRRGRPDGGSTDEDGDVDANAVRIDIGAFDDDHDDDVKDDDVDNNNAPAGDTRPPTPPKLRLQHGAVVGLNQPMTESQFKRRYRIKRSKYKKVDDGRSALATEGGGTSSAVNNSLHQLGAHAGRARISAGRQTCLQSMLACAARREWSFWSTTTFFVGCWMNITLAALDIIGEKFGTVHNMT